MQAARNRFKLLGLVTLLALAAGTALRAGEPTTITTANAMVRTTKKVSPEFPLAAKQLHISGAQEVQVTVSKTGDVIDAKG